MSTLLYIAEEKGEDDDEEESSEEEDYSEDLGNEEPGIDSGCTAVVALLKGTFKYALMSIINAHK